jgi:NADPH:quinone reductase-like Zn-dependent oxidoreductase
MSMTAGQTNPIATSHRMQAVVRDEYGSPQVLRLEEIERPTPRASEVLIRVRAASPNAADLHLLRGQPFMLRMVYGLTTPKIRVLGSAVAGRVEAVGVNVTRFQAGDEVFADLSNSGMGGFAQYACAPEGVLAHKPANLDFTQAAAVPLAAVTALQAMRDKGRIQAGQQVLVYGASGGVGSFAVQLAKHFGAKVTAVCSTRKVELVRSLGADHVVDYRLEDFTGGSTRYDLILAVNGDRSIREYKRALSPNGTCVVVGGSLRQIFAAMLLGPLLGGRQKIVSLTATPSASDLELLRGLLEARKIAPVIDRSYRLSEVPEALQYLAEGRAKGKVIITI